MNTSLLGKAAIVTGASQGIGRKTAITLASAGAHVVLAARNIKGLEMTAALIEESGGNCIIMVTDVTDEKSVQDMTKSVLSEMKTIDILINNSGIAGPTANCEEVEKREWEECIAVNLKGPFLCSKAVIPVMKENKWGRIVNISSITGKMPLIQRTVYATSKLGLIGFTRTLAFEVGRFGITVNAISPGAVEGDRINRVINAAAQGKGVSPEEIRKHFTDRSALGEMVEEKDIAHMVLYLCSEAGSHITAQDFNICSGSVWY